MLLDLIIVMIILPRNLNEHRDEQSTINSEDLEIIKQMDYTIFLKNKNSLFMLVTLIILCLLQSFTSPLISIVINSYGIPQKDIGYIFVFPYLCFIFGAFVLSRVYKY
jgi:uncharacterized membrane protein